MMLDPSAQLQHELDSSIEAALAARRPILFHVNADTTWLLSLPFPVDALCPPGRSRFNILLDPWLQGPQVRDPHQFADRRPNSQHVADCCLCRVMWRAGSAHNGMEFGAVCKQSAN